MKKLFLFIASFVLALPGLTAQSFGQTGLKTASDPPKSEIFNVQKLLTDLQTLSADDMQGRSFGTAGGAKAREYVLKRFKEAGIEQFGNSHLQPFEIARSNGEKLQGANVVGFIKGTRNPEKYIVVTAHYDHVGVRNGQIYNGADDNASGTAALFALAEYFLKNRPENSIILAALDSEETGLRGAKHFVKAPPVKRESMVVNVNMDMIAHNDRNELYAVGTYHYPFLKPLLQEVAKTAGVQLKFGFEGPSVSSLNDWTSQSDHFAFHEVKIPFVYFGVEDHKDYHKPTDDYLNINQAFYVKATETVLAAIKAFDANLPQIEKQKAALK